MLDNPKLLDEVHGGIHELEGAFVASTVWVQGVGLAPILLLDFLLELLQTLLSDGSWHAAQGISDSVNAVSENLERLVEVFGV